MRTSEEIEQELAEVACLPASERRARQAELRKELQAAVEAELATVKTGPRGDCGRMQPTTPIIIENSGFRTTGRNLYEVQGVLDEDGEIWVFYPKSQSWVRMDNDTRYTWTRI